VEYVASWVEVSATAGEAPRCFQLMRAESAAALTEWTRRCEDLVAFEITPVLTSAEHWAARR
jgi:hypothetical protein